ncbi:hypothetical protein THTE_4416 [Thermogutta terrifontis]|uniref:Uncharacterized protein n=1 Tax=Thermogutta terrifontis TaxID=1331910 RepID=A0A286RMB2_9BACT|nr:hypothetical protein THTE_4416 [Thermogutta terrifontis]
MAVDGGWNTEVATNSQYRPCIETGMKKNNNPARRKRRALALKN